MAIATFIYRKSDNRFIGGGFYDAQPPMVAGPNDPQGSPTQVPDFTNYGVAEFGDADLPDLATDVFDPVLGKRAMTAEELVAAAAEAPRMVETRDIIRRMTPEELRALDRFGLLSDHAQAPVVHKLMLTLRTGGPVNAHSAEMKAGMQAIAEIGVAIGIWPDLATAQARAADVLA